MRAAGCRRRRSSPTCAGASTSMTCLPCSMSWWPAASTSRSSSSRPTRRLCCTATRRPDGGIHWLGAGGSAAAYARGASCWGRRARGAAAATREERELLAPLRERADVVIDTTSLTGGALRRRIATELIGRDAQENQLALTILTFGFKNGPPSDADLPLDVRFLPTPHYVDDLRPLTGLDEPVREYVESGTQAGEFYGRLMPLLDFLLPAYVAEGKQHLTIAVGCTGGRHRSVTVADRIARALDKRDDVKLRLVHRDVELEPRAAAR